MERKSFILINSKYLINYKDMEYLEFNNKKLIPLKYIDGNLYYRGFNTYGAPIDPIMWCQWKAEDQVEIDAAFDEYNNSTIEKILLTKSINQNDQ